MAGFPQDHPANSFTELNISWARIIKCCLRFMSAILRTPEVKAIYPINISFSQKIWTLLTCGVDFLFKSQLSKTTLNYTK